jgi:hypothetical protein
VASYSDRALLQLSDPNALTTLLAPDSSAPPSALTTLLEASYDTSNVTIDRVAAVHVDELQVQQPVFPAWCERGTLVRTQPSYGYTDVTLQRTRAIDPQWVDFLARISLDIVVAVDPGGIDSVLSRALADFSTLEQFQAQFSFIDLQAFMTRHHLTTVDDLRNAFEYLRAEIHFTKPPPFDPNDPSNLHTVGVTTAMLIGSTDLTATLRAVALIREIADDVIGVAPDLLLGMPEHPWAPAVIFSAADMTGAGLVAADIATLLANQQVLALFASPP